MNKTAINKADAKNSKNGSGDPKVLIEKIAAELPESKNKFAQAIVQQDLAKLCGLFPSRVKFRQFVSALVIELNLIAPDVLAGLDARGDAGVGAVRIAAANCALLGMVPGRRFGYVHLIPRKSTVGKGRDKRTVQSVNVEVGFRGWLQMAYESKFLASIYTDVVCKGEKFRYGANERGLRLTHLPELDRDVGSTALRGTLTHAYCQYQTRYGGFSGRVVTRKEIDRVDTADYVWASDYYPMAMKTAIIRASKQWQLTSRMELALSLEDATESGYSQGAPIPAISGVEASGHKFSFDDFGADEEDSEEVPDDRKRE